MPFHFIVIASADVFLLMTESLTSVFFSNFVSFDKLVKVEYVQCD